MRRKICTLNYDDYAHSLQTLRLLSIEEYIGDANKFITFLSVYKRDTCYFLRLTTKHHGFVAAIVKLMTVSRLRLVNGDIFLDASGKRAGVSSAFWPRRDDMAEAIDNGVYWAALGDTIATT